MFNITDTTRFNGAIFSLGNRELPPTGENIDIRSSSSNHLVSINGIVPTGAPDTDSITGITIKGGLTSMGKIGSITKAIDLPFVAPMVVGVSGTIDHVPLNPLASKASVTVATIGSLNLLDTTAFPISQVGFSEYFLNNTPYTFTQTSGGISSGTVTFSIPVPGGSIDSMTITNPGVGYDSSATGTVETSASGTKKELSFAINEVYATISLVSGGTLYDTNLASPGYIIAFVGGAYGVIPTGDYSLALDYCGEGYLVKKYAIVKGTANTALMDVLSVDSVGAVRSYVLDSTAIGKDYSVGEATINDLATPLLNPATFIIDSVSGSGGGGGSYTDAEAITALTNSTSPYIVGQTMNANLSVATGLTVLAGGANITGQLDATEAMIDGDLAVITGSLYIDSGDLSVSVGDLQLATGNILSIPLTTVIADEQFTATWVSNGDGTYTLKRHTLATPTTGVIELKQPFVGSGDAVPVGGINRGAIADTENISSATITGTYKYYSADKFQVMIISYGSKFKVVFSGELLIGDTYTANDSVKAIQWDTELAYYFGDATATQQINAGSAGSRTYGPRANVFLPMTRRVAAGVGAGIYEVIAVEIHNQVAGGTTADNYFMRFNTDLAIGDRLLFDGVEYWTESTA
tara:strand:- start:3900 stop:5807 length:1908 start_codon:yes stop_codon:yes gene_type:complete